MLVYENITIKQEDFMYKFCRYNNATYSNMIHHHSSCNRHKPMKEHIKNILLILNFFPETIQTTYSSLNGSDVNHKKQFESFLLHVDWKFLLFFYYFFFVELFFILHCFHDTDRQYWIEWKKKKNESLRNLRQ